MPQHITVSPYDPEWPRQYSAERTHIAAILKDNCIAIYHIGSTAVPGLAAKPIIDILAVVRDLAQVDAAAAQFAAIGYESLGPYGIPGRRYLRKGGDERTHQLHVFQAEDWANIGRHLAFRDYLRTHETARAEYAALKESLAREFPYDIDGYCDGKARFVGALEADALAWYDGAWDRLYIAARSVQHSRMLSPLVEAGAVAAALLTERGSIYVGVSIDTACALGMCAERNAVSSMITHGEQKIRKIVAVMPDGSVGMPCGACRELLMQLDATAGALEILCDLESRRTVRLDALIPDWWHTGR